MEEAQKQGFIVGIALIIASFILGKLVFIPLLINPSNGVWQTATLIAYGLTWVMLFIGIWLAGKEGYLLVVEKYREHQRKTLHAVRQHGKRAAEKTYHIARRAAKLPVKGVAKGKELVRRQITKMHRTKIHRK